MSVEGEAVRAFLAIIARAIVLSGCTSRNWQRLGGQPLDEADLNQTNAICPGEVTSTFTAVHDLPIIYIGCMTKYGYSSASEYTGQRSWTPRTLAPCTEPATGFATQLPTTKPNETTLKG
jgi:hypothetical protein